MGSGRRSWHGVTSGVAALVPTQSVTATPCIEPDSNLRPDEPATTSYGSGAGPMTSASPGTSTSSKNP